CLRLRVERNRALQRGVSVVRAVPLRAIQTGNAKLRVHLLCVAIVLSGEENRESAVRFALTRIRKTVAEIVCDDERLRGLNVAGHQETFFGRDDIAALV